MASPAGWPPLTLSVRCSSPATAASGNLGQSPTGRSERRRRRVSLIDRPRDPRLVAQFVGEDLVRHPVEQVIELGLEATATSRRSEPCEGLCKNRRDRASERLLCRTGTYALDNRRCLFVPVVLVLVALGSHGSSTSQSLSAALTRRGWPGCADLATRHRRRRRPREPDVRRSRPSVPSCRAWLGVDRESERSRGAGAAEGNSLGVLPHTVTLVVLIDHRGLRPRFRGGGSARCGGTGGTPRR
jgi:hypothetical protein